MLRKRSANLSGSISPHEIQAFAGLLSLGGQIAGRGSWAGNTTIWAERINQRLGYRVMVHNRRGEMRLKERGQVVTLSRGEVAEWLNAAVSKTVTSVIPASGVRIPPSPRLGASQHAGFASKSALQHASGLKALAFQLVSYLTPALLDRARRSTTISGRVLCSRRGHGTTG
jgi:hypothetical protein